MIKNKILFSIIVTTYNNEKHIDKCLSEIEKQCNDETELIIIDDGSSDNTVLICKSKIANIKNSRLIINKHLGLSNSRNVGIKQACGDYIIFVDGDDWIGKDYISKATRVVKNKKYDVILIDTIKYFEDTDNYCLENFSFEHLELFPSKSTSEFLINNNICGRAWRVITKRMFLLNNNILFSLSILHEDEEWVTKVFNKYNTIFYAKGIQYFYRKHKNSITSKKTIKNYLDLLYVAKQLFEFSIKYNINYKRYTQYVIFRCIRNSFSNYFRFNNNEKLLLRKWYRSNVEIYKYGVNYTLKARLLCCLFSYKYGMVLYRKLFRIKLDRKDIKILGIELKK